MSAERGSSSTLDVICEEIRHQKAEALRWNRRAVEERQRVQALRAVVHGHVRVIRGMCTDMVDWREIDRALVRLDDAVNPPEDDDEESQR